MYSNGYNVYKTNSVNYASKEQLLLMLVEGAVKFTKIGRQAIIDKDIQKAHNSLIRVQDIFVELMSTLDQSAGDWAVKLFSVYGYIKDKIFQANVKKDVAIIDEILPLIENIRDTWTQAYNISKK